MKNLAKKIWVVQSTDWTQGFQVDKDDNIVIYPTITSAILGATDSHGKPRQITMAMYNFFNGH